MNNNKVKVKKGITLIEVIISVALLSILIIPLATMVLTSLKNKEEALDIQKATYIGQKIIEELKLYDVITLEGDSNNKYFNLLDALDSDKEIKEVSGSELKSFTGNFKRNIFGNKKDNPLEELFDVEVTINKNEDFKNDLNYIDENSTAYKFIFKNNFIYYDEFKSNDTNNATNFVSQNNIVEIEINNNKLTLNSGSESKYIEKINSNENNIIINLEESYTKLTNLEIKNLLKKDLEEGNNISYPVQILIIKEKSSSNNILNIISSEGDILVKEINLDDNLGLKDTYNYEVIVKNEKGKELFKSQSSSRFIIK